ncbi:hypothetical protein D3G64_25760 [Escherichia coli]|nr:hypothetical protein [Escherichia coli]
MDAGNKKLVFWFVRVDDEGIRKLPAASLFTILCKYFLLKVTVKAVTKLDNKAVMNCVIHRHRFTIMPYYEQGNSAAATVGKTL